MHGTFWVFLGTFWVFLVFFKVPVLPNRWYQRLTNSNAPKNNYLKDLISIWVYVCRTYCKFWSEIILFSPKNQVPALLQFATICNDPCLTCKQLCKLFLPRSHSTHLIGLNGSNWISPWSFPVSTEHIAWNGQLDPIGRFVVIYSIFKKWVVSAYNVYKMKS